MRKISIQILIILLVFSTFPVNFSAEVNSETFELEESVFLLSEEVDKEIELLDVETKEVIKEIPDDSEVTLLEIVDEEYVLIQYLTVDKEGNEVLLEGLVHIEYVFDRDEAEGYRSTREQQVKESEIDSNKNENSTKDDLDIKADENNKPKVSTNKSSLSENTDTFTTQSITLFSLDESTKGTATSRLGHIRNRNVDIYPELGKNNSFKAGSEYTNAVYYIKRQAKVGKDTYYLLSTQPSASAGVVGWAKSTDLSTHPHVGVDKKSKSFLVKGNGKATTKAWGGNKDTVHPDMSEFKGHVFHVNLTEKVGNNTWYRGKIEGNGQTVWLHSSYVVDATIKQTSRLGHIRSGNVTIYEKLGGKSFKAGSTYTNAVYYIKAEANYQGQLYYLLSTSPSATNGVVGWAKSSDLSTHPHVGVDKQRKTFYIKGNGKATTKAWGGNKDTVYSNLSGYKNSAFEVNLTEKVGNNTWYRGMLDGRQVWLHSSYVHSPQFSATSRLGHIRSGTVDLFKQLGGDSFKAGSKYTNAVYYIKQQAVFGSGSQAETYYLLSKNPSATTGVVGWAKSTDLSTHLHTGVSKTPRVLIIKNNVIAYTKAWGGSKDLAHNDMSQFEGANFHVNLTEKVGNNTWYRGKINNSGGNIWFHSSNVAMIHETSTNYGLTLDQAIDMQTAATISKSNKWIPATKNEVRQYMDPKNYVNDPEQRFQFLVLNKPSGATVAAMNKYLAGRGVLANKGRQFYEAARKNNINDLYAIAHARLETGNGSSLLSNGSIEVGTLGLDKWYVQVNSSKATYHIAEYKDSKWSITKTSATTRLTAKDIKKIYNMFGIGAFDSNPNVYGAVEAYKQEWFSVDAAIAGGITWIDNGYINNEYGQNTLYKMRWNPKMSEGYAWKQYATDVGWAYKQAELIADMYQKVEGINNYYFDIPNYN